MSNDGNSGHDLGHVSKKKTVVYMLTKQVKIQPSYNNW